MSNIGRLVFTALLIAALAACSLVRMAYNQADTLAYWSLDEAFDFSDAQSKRVHQDLAAWFEWHRHTQLPRYAAWLVPVQSEALQTLSPAHACERRLEIQTMAMDSLDHALPMLADIVLDLSPAQIAHLRAYQEKSNRKFGKDYLPDDSADRVEAATKPLRRLAEYFYGRLDNAQREALQAQVAAMPINAMIIQDERLRQEKNFMQLIESLQARHASKGEAQQALHDFYHEAIIPQHEPQHSKVAHWIQAGCALTATLHNATTFEQKQNAAQRLKSWHDDFLILAKQP